MTEKINCVFVIVVIGWLSVISYSLKSNPDPFVWSDENGCQYLIENGGLTPRNHPNGTQICNK